MRWRTLVLVGLVVTSLWPAPVGAQEPTPLSDGPSEAGAVHGAPAPESAEATATRPLFQLPFRWDEAWQAGSPHESNWSALDFGPRRTGGNDDVVASAPGTVQRVTCSGGSYPQVDHGNGWVSRYYHVINVNWSLVGHHVVAGTRLGDAGQATPCGGRSTFRHVHFTVLHHGNPVSANGVSMGGYTVHSAGTEYDGHWTRDGDGAVVVVNPNEARCCLRSTTRAFFVPDRGALADVNGDGRDDVVLRRGTTISISTDSAVGGGDPAPERRFTWGRNTDRVFLGDVTGDGRADFVFRRGAEYFVNHDLLRPGGDPGSDLRFTWGARTDRFHLADVDGDDRDDFVLRSGPSISISTDTVAAGGDHNTDRRFSLGVATDQVHLGDVTGDGLADFVLKRGNRYLVDHDVLTPGGSPGADRRFRWGASGGRLDLGDVDGDGRDDFVLRFGTSIGVSIDSVVPGGDASTERRISWGRGTDLLHLGDVTGDGTVDLLLRRGRNFFVNDDGFVVSGDAAGDRAFVAGIGSDALVVQPTTSP
jgi:hypothetical protein